MRDLTKNERTIVGLKTKDFSSKDKNQVQHGATVKIIKECAASGVTCCPRTIKNTAQDMRNHQHLNDLTLQYKINILHFQSYIFTQKEEQATVGSLSL